MRLSLFDDNAHRSDFTRSQKFLQTNASAQTHGCLCVKSNYVGTNDQVTWEIVETSEVKVKISLQTQKQALIFRTNPQFLPCFRFSRSPTHRALLCTRQCAWPVRGPHVRWWCALAWPPPAERQKPAWCWPSRRRPHCLAMETRPSSWPPPHHDPDKTSRLQRAATEQRLAKL